MYISYLIRYMCTHLLVRGVLAVELCCVVYHALEQAFLPPHFLYIAAATTTCFSSFPSFTYCQQPPCPPPSGRWAVPQLTYRVTPRQLAHFVFFVFLFFSVERAVSRDMGKGSCLSAILPGSRANPADLPRSCSTSCARQACLGNLRLLRDAEGWQTCDAREIDAIASALAVGDVVPQMRAAD